MKYNKKQSGFTLIELSIVLVIVGLIVAGVIGGQSIIHSAKLRSVITDINGFKAAILTYEDYYGQPPGDHDNAKAYWPTQCTDIAANDCNGNGNGSITKHSEDYRAWQHLNLSGMVPGNLSGLRAVPAGCLIYIGVNVPPSKVDGAGYWIADERAYYGRRNNSIMVASEWACYLYGGAFSTPDAQAIDKKVDDGLADSGEVYTINGLGQTSCVTGAENDPTSSYILDNMDKTCKINFWLEK